MSGKLHEGVFIIQWGGIFLWHGTLFSSLALMDSDRNVFIPAAAEIVLLWFFFQLPYGSVWRVVTRCKTHLHCLVSAALSDCVQHQSSSLHPFQAPPTIHDLQVSADRQLESRFYMIYIIIFNAHHSALIVLHRWLPVTQDGWEVPVALSSFLHDSMWTHS